MEATNNQTNKFTDEFISKAKLWLVFNPRPNTYSGTELEYAYDNMFFIGQAVEPRRTRFI